jgi:hypothetical protein
MNSVLKEQIENFIETRVVQNSDQLYKQDMEWADFQGPEELTEYEIKVNENFITPAKLLEEEKNYVEPELTEEQFKKKKKDEYIQKIKVIALHMAQKPILSNPSYMKPKEKNLIIKNMQAVIDNMNDEDITTRFNEIVREELFESNIDYSKFPLKRF